MSDDPAPQPEPIEPPEDYEFLEGEVETAAVEVPSRRRSTAASGRGWGPGWPANNAAQMATVRAGGIALSVRREIAPLVQWLVTETATRGYGLRDGQCWGFANRPIRGTNTPSNHSWGLAVDLNSLANPMGDALVTDMPGWMVELWKSKKFRWGDDYRGRKDAMHFEFMGTPDEAVQLGQDVAGGGSSGGGQANPSTVPAEQPGSGATGPLLKKGAEGSDVRRLQARLTAAGFQCAVDGDFGPATAHAVRAFQGARGLSIDGVVGPRTWAALG